MPTDAVTRTMRKCRSGNALERSLWGCLAGNGIKGWRKNDKSLPGEPDVSFPSLCFAVFVNGCFWHSCQRHRRLPKTNRRYWRNKFARNRRRDAKAKRALNRLGWEVMTVWEHEAKSRGWGRLLGRVA